VRSSSFAFAVKEKFRGLANEFRALANVIDLVIATGRLDDLADLRRRD
jgi:hypothetical protein